MSSCGLPESVWLPSRSLAILNFVRPYRGRSPGRSCASSWEPLASCDDRRGNTMTVERVAVKDLKLNEPVTSFFQVRNPQRRLRKTGEPFVTLVLGDGTGELPAVMWEDADGIGEQIREGGLGELEGGAPEAPLHEHLRGGRLRRSLCRRPGGQGASPCVPRRAVGAHRIGGEAVRDHRRPLRRGR